ncbi:hypothetical protein [Streptomyces parvulus]|uniref:hypothetical protein n=1 Tax=Streptomyces parvulus TaxID=146923 RepID=UPI0034186B1C
MLALRLTRAAHLAVHLRRLLVAVASAGTGFLLLCALGHAMSHPDTPGTSALRLAWCAAPLAATVYLAVAVARTDPGTRPRSGLSAIGLGPGRLMAVSATTTALAGALGSVAALGLYLHLRGDLAGPPVDGLAAGALAVGQSLPAPATLTLLALVPAAASAAVAWNLRPREPRRARTNDVRGYGRFGAYGWGKARETFGTYGRFGARWTSSTPSSAEAGSAGPSDLPHGGAALLTRAGEGDDATAPDGSPPAQDAAPALPAPRPANTTVLPWGIAVLAAGLTVETYTGQPATAPDTTPSAGVLIGWALTALGLALAGPGLTHLCGRLLQAARPGALRLLAGRVLMDEAHRIGRPLGVLCAVAAAGYVAGTLYAADGPDFGPLSTLGAVLVAGCTAATLLTAAVEAKHARADTTDALLRLGAPPATLRGAAAVRALALLALFGPLTLAVAELAALPLSR